MLVLRRVIVCFTIILMLTLSALAQASEPDTQEAKKATGAISGRVTINGKPASGIAVGLRPGAYDQTTQTDEDGRYRLTVTEAGRYFVTTFSFAYAPPIEDATFGEPGKVVMVGEGEEVEGVDLALAPAGVISGRITDARGHPLIGLHVEVSRLDERTPMRGEALRKMYLFGFSSLLVLSTDDRGVYRICGLPEGNYLIGVKSEPTQPLIYHPGVSDLRKAVPVKVLAGRETDHVNIQFGALAKTYTVSGQIIDAETGQSVADLMRGSIIMRPNGLPTMAMLVCDSEKLDAQGQFIGYDSNGLPCQADGRGNFEIKNLAPGRYRLRVVSDLRRETWYANPLYFEVTERDVTGLEMKCYRGATISGLLTIEGEAWNDDDWGGMYLEATVITSEAGAHPAVQSRTTPGHHFEIRGLPPGRVTIRFVNSRWTQYSLQRVEYNGTPVRNLIEPGADGQLTGGIEVKAGENISGVDVFIIPSSGRLQGQVQIVGGTLPEGLRLWVQCRRINSQSGFAAQAEVDALGHFVIQKLSAGDYELQLDAPSLTAADPLTRPQLQAIKQTVSVQNEAVSNVTLTLHLRARDKEREP